jgi:predicted transcriptional regulator
MSHMQKPDPISTRLDQDVLDRLTAEAARRDWSRSQTIARAVDIGLSHLEAQVALPFAAEAS